MTALRRAALAILVSVVLTGPAAAQDLAGTTSTVAESSPGILPKPDSGDAPSEAGDRGGALQLGLLGLVVVVFVGVGAGLVRQSRRARGL